MHRIVLNQPTTAATANFGGALQGAIVQPLVAAAAAAATTTTALEQNSYCFIDEPPPPLLSNPLLFRFLDRRTASPRGRSRKPLASRDPFQGLPKIIPQKTLTSTLRAKPSGRATRWNLRPPPSPTRLSLRSHADAGMVAVALVVSLPGFPAAVTGASFVGVMLASIPHTALWPAPISPRPIRARRALRPARHSWRPLSCCSASRVLLVVEFRVRNRRGCDETRPKAKSGEGRYVGWGGRREVQSSTSPPSRKGGFLFETVLFETEQTQRWIRGTGGFRPTATLVTHAEGSKAGCDRAHHVCSPVSWGPACDNTFRKKLPTHEPSSAGGVSGAILRRNPTRGSGHTLQGKSALQVRRSHDEAMAIRQNRR